MSYCHTLLLGKWQLMHLNTAYTLNVLHSYTRLVAEGSARREERVDKPNASQIQAKALAIYCHTLIHSYLAILVQ